MNPHIPLTIVFLHPNLTPQKNEKTDFNIISVYICGDVS